MGKIKVTLFALPDGYKNVLEKEIGSEMGYKMARMLEQAGYRLEIEELRNNELGVSLDGFSPDINEDGYVCLTVCKYEEQALADALLKVINEGFAVVKAWGRL